MEDLTILITCAGGPGGISMIKSLKGKPGISRIIAVNSDPLCLGLYREDVSKSFQVPKGSEPEYIPALFKIIEEEDVDVVIPGSDEEVTALSKNEGVFESHDVKIPVSEYGAVKIADNKYLTAKKAQESDIPSPDSYLLNNVNDLDKINCRFPIVLKPTYGRGSKGVKYINNQKELKPVFKKLDKDHDSAIIAQEMIPGGEGSIQLFATIFDENQNMRTTFMSRSLRTKYPRGGPGVVGEPIYDEELKNNAQKLLKSIDGWYGPVNVEFKRDERDNTLKLLEINPRYWGYSYLSTAAGINFPYITAKLAVGETIEEVHTYRTDIVTMRSNEDKVVKKSRINQLKEDFSHH